MSELPEGNAIVYAQGAFNTPNGKTAHGLVRFTRRYRVLCVVDSRLAGRDSGEILDDRPNGIPIYSSVQEAFQQTQSGGTPATHFVIGLAPDGGRLSPSGRSAVRAAIELGLDIDSGLHDYLNEDTELSAVARANQVRIRDVRKPPPVNQLHFFTGKIEDVRCLKIALLGTDSAVGKRTTAWFLVDGLVRAGLRAELIGTGQTAWMQGVRYGLLLDSLVNDFLTGEIEHAVWHCWSEQRPDVIVIEGQGSLLHPAYPGGYEILAAARPDAVVLQHAPTREVYDGFPNYRLHPLRHQIRAVEVISGKPVVAITINHEGLTREQIPGVCRRITRETGLPAFDVLIDGADGLVDVARKLIRSL